MGKATLAVSLPQTSKDSVAAKPREGRFSAPRQDIGSLFRDDQDLTGKADLALFARGATPASRVENGRFQRTIII